MSPSSLAKIKHTLSKRSQQKESKLISVDRNSQYQECLYVNADWNITSVNQLSNHTIMVSLSNFLIQFLLLILHNLKHQS